MTIRSESLENQSLIHSVDEAKSGYGHVITVLPQLADEARHIMQGLVTLTVAKLGKGAYRFFTAGGIE